MQVEIFEAAASGQGENCSQQADLPFGRTVIMQVNFTYDTSNLRRISHLYLHHVPRTDQVQGTTVSLR